MKSVTRRKTKKITTTADFPFPCLLQYQLFDLVILATGVVENKCIVGTVVNKNDYQPIGYYSDHWDSDASCWSLFDSCIELSND